MTKITKTRYHYNKSIHWNAFHDYQLQELIDDLTKLRDDGMIGVEIEYEEDNGTLHISPFTQTLETDDEYNTRLEREEERRILQIQHDLARLKELKEKYEKD